MINSVLVPAFVRGCLDNHGLNHRPILLALDTDVTLNGQPAKEWIVVTPDHVSLLDESPSGDLLRYVATTDIEEVRTHNGVGSGLLQLKINGHWIDWLRYSNAMATRFHKVSRLLQRACEASKEQGRWVLPALEEDSLDPKRCPKCSLRLQQGSDSCPRCVPKGQVLKRVIDLIRPYRGGAIMLCVLTIIGVIAELIPPRLQQTMVDEILTVPTHQSVVTSPVQNGLPVQEGLSTGAPTTEQVDFKTALLVVVLSLALSRIALSGVAVFKGRLATRIGTGLTSTLRAQMVEKLQSLAIAYYDRHQVGSMLSRVAHDSEVLHGLMHQFTGGFLLQVVQLFGVGAMLLWINPKLALFTLIPVPLVFLGSWVFWRKVYPRHYRLWDASSKQMSVLSGMLSGIRVVKAFAQEDREFQRFRSTSDQLRDWRLWVETTNANYSAAMQIVFSLGGLIVWYVGGRDVIGRDMTLGQLIAFLAYLAMFYAPLSALSNFTTWLTSFLSGSQRVLELLDTPLAITDSQQPQPWNDPRGAIRFENVSFGYDRNQPVLKNISFDVAAGEMVGIVGRSGSGKTTMVNLLGRFYDVQEGSITVDGIDIRQISRHQLRERLGIVFQDSFLFRGTIWKNLSYGAPNTELEAGLSAAKAAGAHDFICRQPLAYETLLGEQGAGLSGGEKQRLSIARTLLYNPRILVLDEATSNIDAEAERSIQQALEVLIRGRTTVAIAHRLSTLRNADRILVFDRGVLSEHGTHAELLAADGIYARLVRMQTQVTKDPSIDRLVSEQELRTTNASGQVTHRKQASDNSSDSTDGDSSVATLTQKSAKKEHSLSADSLDHVSNRVDQRVVQEHKTEPARHEFIDWLSPEDCQFAIGTHGQLEIKRNGESLCSSAFVICAFPASHPEEYLSIRGWNESGDEIEVGMIRDLSTWPEQDRKLINDSLARRYLLREIVAVDRVSLSHGYLDLNVKTSTGPANFTMRWTQSQAIDFGEDGKLLIDTEENRFVIRDMDSLPARDRERFLQYVYW